MKNPIMKLENCMNVQYSIVIKKFETVLVHFLSKLRDCPTSKRKASSDNSLNFSKLSKLSSSNILYRYSQYNFIKVGYYVDMLWR